MNLKGLGQRRWMQESAQHSEFLRVEQKSNSLINIDSVQVDIQRSVHSANNATKKMS